MGIIFPHKMRRSRQIFENIGFHFSARYSARFPNLILMVSVIYIMKSKILKNYTVQPRSNFSSSHALARCVRVVRFFRPTVIKQNFDGRTLSLIGLVVH